MAENRRIHTDKEGIAEAFLLRLQGYEDSVNVMKNRYLYSAYTRNGDTASLLCEYRQMGDEANAVRKEVFRALDALDDDASRKALWMLYVERKQLDEVAGWLGISVEKVTVLRGKGLRSIKVPEYFRKAVLRRRYED